MSQFLANQYRTNTKFHQSHVTQILPEFYQEQYPDLIRFIEAYYKYTGEDGSVSFNEQIQDLFNIRNISSTDIRHLDLLIGEISDGLESSSFYQNPRLMARLLSQFYRNKGTQLSAEQFFKAFYNETVEVSYPKRNIFILNDKPGGSLIGPESLKYIQDNKRYQIFSVLLKTGLSLNDYEALYKKLVHPAGFYLSAEVETQGIADINLRAGVTTDPLEIPNYPVAVQGTALPTAMTSRYNLLTMEENGVDTGIIISSLETLNRFTNVSLEDLMNDYGTVADWVSVKAASLDDGNLDLSSGYETLDGDDYL